MFDAPTEVGLPTAWLLAGGESAESPKPSGEGASTEPGAQGIDWDATWADASPYIQDITCPGGASPLDLTGRAPSDVEQSLALTTEIARSALESAEQTILDALRHEPPKALHPKAAQSLSPEPPKALRHEPPIAHAGCWEPVVQGFGGLESRVAAPAPALTLPPPTSEPLPTAPQVPPHAPSYAPQPLHQVPPRAPSSAPQPIYQVPPHARSSASQPIHQVPPHAHPMSTTTPAGGQPPPIPTYHPQPTHRPIMIHHPNTTGQRPENSPHAARFVPIKHRSDATEPSSRHLRTESSGAPPASSVPRTLLMIAAGLLLFGLLTNAVRPQATQLVEKVMGPNPSQARREAAEAERAAILRALASLESRSAAASNEATSNDESVSDSHDIASPVSDTNDLAPSASGDSAPSASDESALGAPSASPGDTSVRTGRRSQAPHHATPAESTEEPEIDLGF